ncbi:hypothetical protein [Rickettsia prowazekii]|uniref:Uncharacterized protein RP612 n=1 Tax=Rickettsia prowazekii (strain Madrid E) TaxID=272947 RepID=Y612_RICPR|nr:hypothetical protein [Rickettsia prowazekii]P50938.2 RecName: Full=Uncharacterized protein RP612 [Rickettsia prowazekii str. Madrid E]CAA15056.1 unknown [Rickettsia prowazekii str. Madrid E]
MQKILIEGYDISKDNANPDIKEIRNLDHLPSAKACEYFIHAHGAEFFYQNSHLGLLGKIQSYFMPDPSYLSLTMSSNGGATPMLDITLLNKIQRNTPANQCNIVHIFSCCSGAAQHHLDFIEGNIVLCTYNKASDNNVTQLANSNYETRIKKHSSLIEYIHDNFHLLVASDFSISYKLDNEIYNFSLSSDNIKNMKSIEELPVFLYKEYGTFVKFYQNIYAKYHVSYPEIFNISIGTKPKGLTYADLVRVFTRALTLETYNFNKFSLSKIENLLHQKGLNTDFSVDQAIEQENFELLTSLLNYDNTNIQFYTINKTIDKGNLDILKAVVAHSTTKIESYNIDRAIDKGNLDILKAVVAHSTTKIESYNIDRAIDKGNLDILKAVVAHSTTKIESYNIDRAIDKGNLDILKAVVAHSTTKIESYNIDRAIDKGNLDILKAVVAHSTTKIESYNIDRAIDKGNLDILKAVVAHSTTKIESYNIDRAIDKGNLDILKAVVAHSTTKIESYNFNTVIKIGNLEMLDIILQHSYNSEELVTKYHNYTINNIMPEVNTIPTIEEDVSILGAEIV